MVSHSQSTRKVRESGSSDGEHGELPQARAGAGSGMHPHPVSGGSPISLLLSHCMNRSEIPESSPHPGDCSEPWAFPLMDKLDSCSSCCHPWKTPLQEQVDFQRGPWNFAESTINLLHVENSLFRILRRKEGTEGGRKQGREGGREEKKMFKSHWSIVSLNIFLLLSRNFLSTENLFVQLYFIHFHFLFFLYLLYCHFYK